MSKLKITIEKEGQPTRVVEAKGMAAAFLNDAEDANHHNLQVCVVGRMSGKDLYHLAEAVKNELTDTLERRVVETVLEDMPTKELLKMLLGGE